MPLTEEAELADDAFLSLDTLPTGHMLRNSPLAKLEAEYQWISTKQPKHWNRVTPSFKIAKSRFNELGATWTASYRWRVKKWESKYE